MEVLFGYVALMFVGVALGVTGTGGSMLAIPVLVYFFSLDAVMASAYSMFLVGFTSLAGSFLKKQKQLVDVRTGAFFGAPSVVAAFVARKWLVVALPDVVFQRSAFTLTKDTLLLVLLSLLMITSSLSIICKGNADGERQGAPQKLLLVLAGLLVGLLAGLVGAGGGVLILPALLFFGRLPFKRAVGTTLVIIASNCLLGFCGDVLNHTLNWLFVLSLSAVALIGMYVGEVAEKYLFPSVSWHKAFGWILLLMALCMLVNELVFMT
jgi:uncharacterized membrane protein YfcA